jgi:LEA14-like dessication related protein
MLRNSDSTLQIFRNALRFVLGHLRAFAVILVGASALALSACAGIPPVNLKSPTLSFSDLALKDINFSEIKFQVVVKADNPNDVDIPMSNLKFDLNLLGQPFATGTGAGTGNLNLMRLPRKASADLPINFTVSTSRVIDLLRKVKFNDWASLSYQLKGSANWGESSLFSIPFERQGNLESLKKLRDIFALIPGAK